MISLAQEPVTPSTFNKSPIFAGNGIPVALCGSWALTRLVRSQLYRWD